MNFILYNFHKITSQLTSFQIILARVKRHWVPLLQGVESKPIIFWGKKIISFSEEFVLHSNEPFLNQRGAHV